MRFILIVVTALMTVGCVTQEGVSLGNSEWGVEEIVEQRESRETLADPALRDVPVDLIAIGTVSAFRPLTTKNTEDIYSEYVNFATRLNPDRPADLSAEDFQNEIAGWTKLKLYSVPLILAGYEYALVPNGIHQEIRFPSAFGTTLVQESGDLVVARTNSDGYFIIKQILCKRDRGNSTCAKKYNKGLFSGSTGEKLDYKTLIPKKSGKRIDPASYLAIEASP